MLIPITLTTLAAAVTITTTSQDNPRPAPVPALQVISAYGRLAGPTCYGRIAPPGSSCQLPLSYLKEELHLGIGRDGKLPTSSSLTRDDFGKRLDDLPFRWPLKPYGRNEKSLGKTSIMNKGAETALYMDEIERRGIYDRRDPIGPLPTSLRPKINDEIGKEGVDPGTVDTVFRALAGGRSELTELQLERLYDGRESLDYYSFLGIIGNDNVQWPRPSEVK